MIVLNNNEPKADMKEKEAYTEMFRKELDAFCTYKTWSDETDDNLLAMALEEIMEDEYLHARFLRDYMIENDMYSLSADDPHEKKFWKIHRKFFRD